jgi:putative transposase
MLSRDYNINQLCDFMGVSRSGYYKWKKHKPSSRDIDREEMIKMVSNVHGDHLTHGYRWTAAFISNIMHELINIISDKQNNCKNCLK